MYWLLLLSVFLYSDRTPPHSPSTQTEEPAEQKGDAGQIEFHISDIKKVRGLLARIGRGEPGLVLER